jgi:hypothetical protein
MKYIVFRFLKTVMVLTEFNEKYYVAFKLRNCIPQSTLLVRKHSKISEVCQSSE